VALGILLALRVYFIKRRIAKLLASLKKKVIAPAIAKAQEIEERHKAIEQELAKRPSTQIL
jgi:hypothetical protein